MSKVGFGYAGAMGDPDTPITTTTDTVSPEDWVTAKEIIGDMGAVLHAIASQSGDAETVRCAVNVLVKHDLLTEEL